MYGRNFTSSDERAAMQTLRDQGVAKVVIDFSGGNDEGGADAASFLDANGDGVKMPDSGVNAYERERWDSANQRYVSEGWVVWSVGPTGKQEQREATAEEIAAAKLEKVLEAPIYDRWGSFAGEFYVHGTLEWDVATGKHKLTGSESHEVWDSFEY